jgi:hypothetical protein
LRRLGLSTKPIIFAIFLNKNNEAKEKKNINDNSTSKWYSLFNFTEFTSSIIA